MLQSSPSAPEVHARVTTLPETFLVRRTTEHWAVVGPTGMFLIGKGERDPERAAARTALAAHELRNRLCESIDIVPFVDPVLVTHDPQPGSTCTMVEVELLSSLLTNGPVVIPEDELAILRRHLPDAVASIESDGGL